MNSDPVPVKQVNRFSTIWRVTVMSTHHLVDYSDHRVYVEAVMSMWKIYSSHTLP